MWNKTNVIVVDLWPNFEALQTNEIISTNTAVLFDRGSSGKRYEWCALRAPTTEDKDANWIKYFTLQEGIGEIMNLVSSEGIEFLLHFFFSDEPSAEWRDKRT